MSSRCRASTPILNYVYFDEPARVTRCDGSGNGRAPLLQLLFSTKAFLDSIQIAILVKELRALADSPFSSITERLPPKLFMLRRFFVRLSAPVIVPRYNTLGRPHLAYAMPSCSPTLTTDGNILQRIQRFATGFINFFQHFLPIRGYDSWVCILKPFVTFLEISWVLATVSMKDWT